MKTGRKPHRSIPNGRIYKTPGCWYWIAERSQKPITEYRPMLKIGKERKQVGTWLYERKYGPIPGSKLLCHTCDNPPCIRLSHRFVGTMSENILDCVQKGRNAGMGYFTRNPIQRFHVTPSIVRRIRLDKRPGKVVAADYGITPSTVSKIRLKHTWSHI